MNHKLPYGIYDSLIDTALQEILSQYPELRSVLGKIDPEEQPARYADFIARIVQQVLREEPDSDKRREMFNALLDRVFEQSKDDKRSSKQVSDNNSVLLEITPPCYARPGIPWPHTSISESSLFTGSPREPQLIHELQAEMKSADEVEILVSFIKWSGLRLLMPAFEELRERNVTVRLITTSYMGASDASVVEWLARMTNVHIRVSYDTKRTRLHAKAYHFKRLSGFSTAFIGSANMSQAAMTSGLEWNLKVTEQDQEHILEKFRAEFETYWNSHEFVPFDPDSPQQLREVISRARNPKDFAQVFFDLKPHPLKMTWDLWYPMPVEIFERNRVGG